jgi:hypothetical protein
MIRARLFLPTFVLLASLAVPVPAVAAPAAVDYGNPANWLCLPGRQDACAQPMTATVFADDGTVTKRSYDVDPNAPVDCFYVYPTASHEPTANADLTASPELQHAALEQFERFGARCKLYAPLYRQVTVAVLKGAAHDPDNEMAYNDVLAAWNLYLARYNHGRGVVLIGHSQGTKILARLIASQMDGTGEQKLLISAIILGGDVETPVGRDVGGTFKHVPLCRTAVQVGCVIAYSTYLATDPPGKGAYFGGAQPGFTDACVDPVALDGQTLVKDELPPMGSLARAFGTSFIETPAQLSAGCATNEGHTYLAITPGSDPRSAVLRVAFQDIQQRMTGWGLHILDVNVAMGNLLDLVGTESKAWLGRQHAGT